MSVDGRPQRRACVAVVIPCYRYGRFLPSSVGSALAQEGVDVKVLVIDDASPDGSASMARGLAASDARVTVREHVTNQGHIRTYNEGLKWADADYTVLLSADDLLVPGALARAAALLDAHPKVTFTYGRPVRFLDDAALPATRTTSRGWSVWAGHWWLSRRFREATGCITSAEVVVRTAVQHQVGGYDPDLPHAGDLEMWLRLAAHGDVGYLKGVDQALYRVHPQSMSQSRFHGILTDLTQRRRAFDTVAERYADRIPDADDLRAQAHCRLAHEALVQAVRAYDRGRVDVVPVDELVSFALDCDPQARSTLAYRSLRLRMRLGDSARYLGPLSVPAAARRVRNELWWMSWRRRGI